MSDDDRARLDRIEAMLEGAPSPRLATCAPRVICQHMGRPKGTTKADARKAIQVRLSPAERLQLDAAAAREGMPLSTWLRWLGLRAAGISPETSAKQGLAEKR